MSEKRVNFVRRYADLDDDSFWYWALEERIPKEDWRQLYRAKAVWDVGGEEYGGRLYWVWKPKKAIPILKKMGYIIENEEAVLEAVQQEEEEDRKSREMCEKAAAAEIKCQKCGKVMEVSQHGPRAALLKCWKCDTYAIFTEKGKKIEGDGEKMYELFDKIHHPKFFKWLEEQEKEVKRWDRAIKKILKWPGEYPWGPNGEQIPFPKGEKLEDKEFKPNIYGSGIWYVIQEDAIWYIQENGTDGDDWSLNNIATGGAGAIGKKCPRDPELEALVRYRATTEPPDILWLTGQLPRPAISTEVLLLFLTK